MGVFFLMMLMVSSLVEFGRFLCNAGCVYNVALLSSLCYNLGGGMGGLDWLPLASGQSSSAEG